MLRTENHIFIRTQADVAFELASGVIRWPEFLDHYRYVRLIDAGDGTNIGRMRRVKMGARRGVIPVSWTAVQELDAEHLQITYRHVAGVTAGMWVVWSMQPERNGVNVTVSHELESQKRWLRNPLSEHIVGHWFVTAIAANTLSGIKREAEKRSQ